jgi:hypothetical protein
MMPKWYNETYNRLQTESYLADKEIGVFVVRKSETHQDCYVLSVKVPKYMNFNEVAHYLILQTRANNKKEMCFCVKGFQKEFQDLKSLVTHCSMMRDILPIMLNVEFYKKQELDYNERKEANEFIYYFSSSGSTSSLLSTTSSTSSHISDCESI